MRYIYLYISTKKVDDNYRPDVSVGNVGDICSYYILHAILHSRRSTLSIIPFFHIPKFYTRITDDKFLGMVGSIIRKNPCRMSNMTIVGSGIIDNRLPNIDKNVRFVGVRGYKTQKLLEQHIGYKPKVIGDLGLLMPLAFPSGDVAKEYECGLIIHTVDRQAFSKYRSKWDFIDIPHHNEPEKYIQLLVKCKRIISSSLHGIIFAHAYGIPALGIKITDNVSGGDFKFKDYYSSLDHPYSGRTNFFSCINYTGKDWLRHIDTSWNPPLDRIAALRTKQLQVVNNLLDEWEK
jgi:hypothetical protein